MRPETWRRGWAFGANVAEKRENKLSGGLPMSAGTTAPHSIPIPLPLRRLALPLVMAAALGLGACSNMSTTEQRTLSGGAVGAVAGTVGAAITGGCVWCGTLIGSAVGAGAGYVYDQLNKGSR